MSESDPIKVSLTVDELRYVISVGIALAQHVPDKSLPTYCGFDKAQIVSFSGRMRAELDRLGLDM